MSIDAMFRPGMRTYFIPLAAGVVLTVSAFLPWVTIGGISMIGVPDSAALWVAGLGIVAAVLAVLSLITRKNSRHPLLIVGLVALGIMFLEWRVMPAAVGDRALIASQAEAIVDGGTVATAPSALPASGIYVGLAASVVLVGFGLTIIVKRVSQPYAIAETDDDV